MTEEYQLWLPCSTYNANITCLSKNCLIFFPHYNVLLCYSRTLEHVNLSWVLISCSQYAKLNLNKRPESNRGLSVSSPHFKPLQCQLQCVQSVSVFKLLN